MQERFSLAACIEAQIQANTIANLHKAQPNHILPAAVPLSQCLTYQWPCDEPQESFEGGAHTAVQLQKSADAACLQL